ncbi:hypothetical protein N9V13_05225 [Betaproteobacteria bacterium]|nr:hypothetical protein [Betaproteobacteria bacterium]
MNKSLTIFCVGLFLVSCSNFELSSIEKKSAKNFDNNNPDHVCLGSENKKVCLENMTLVNELKKYNSEIMIELKKQKREIQELKRNFTQQCMSQGGIVVGNDCLIN